MFFSVDMLELVDSIYRFLNRIKYKKEEELEWILD